MRMVLVVVALAGCQDSAEQPPDAPDTNPVSAWRDGRILRALLVETDDGIRGLAGRIDLSTGARCPIAADEVTTAVAATCPHEVWMMYRAQDCTMQDIAIDPDGLALPQYVSANTAQGLKHFELGEPYTGPMFWKPAGATFCSAQASGEARVAREIDPSLVLGTPARHGTSDSYYETSEMPDGFSIVTRLSPPGTIVEEGRSRARVRYAVRGAKRRFAGFYDAVLQAPCVVAEAADGLRCMPAAPTQILQAQTGTCSDRYALFATTRGPAVEIKPGWPWPRIKQYRCDQPSSFYTGGHKWPCIKREGFSCVEDPSALPTLRLVAAELYDPIDPAQVLDRGN